MGLLFIRPLSEKCAVACPLVLLFRYFNLRMKKRQGLQSSLESSNLARNRKDARTRFPHGFFIPIHTSPLRQRELSPGKVFADVPGTVSKVFSGSGCGVVIGSETQDCRYLPRLAR